MLFWFEVWVIVPILSAFVFGGAAYWYIIHQPKKKGMIFDEGWSRRWQFAKVLFAAFLGGLGGLGAVVWGLSCGI